MSGVSSEGTNDRGSLGRIWRIARWEVTRSAGTVDRKTIAVVLVLLLAAGFVGYSTVDDGVGLEDGLYTVAVDEESPYYEVATTDRTFRTVDPGEPADLTVYANGHVNPAETAKGNAAHAAFADAVERHNEALMIAESDTAAAFPVSVTLVYEQREPLEAVGDGDLEGDDGDGGTEADGDSTATDGSSDDGTGSESADDDASAIATPEFGGGSIDDSSGPQTPGSITPPFPFQSLVLAFLFVVPMNFVIQAYGSTIMDERIKRRGELLLVSPASRYEIVAGKTLPYLVGVTGLVGAIALVIDGGWLSVAAVIPIALLFLAATFVGAMFARSFKELTFVTVTISVFLTTYTFVPAIFTDVTPIALISPLTLVVLDLQGESVRVVEYLFSTATFYLGSAVLFGLGLGSYREEDMFTQKPIPAKVVDSIATQVRGKASVFAMPIVFIPFVFGIQLLTVSLVFALPQTLSLPIIFLVAAAVEEVAKSIHIYAGYSHSRFDSSSKTALVLGAISGLGFFVGEKLTHVVQLVGLPDIVEGQAAFGPALAGESLPVLVAIALAPLVLHVVTAMIGALGASRGRGSYFVALALATAVHATYNLGVITLVF
ncbi:PrsW family intramembrane metalloprotease [Natronosalvus amylolyticus]|uniref:PrsW family intramembrane metalloprotease n=1 Tax=Natronosalvus amylolyticus TaxID=2961994 RepID=UPI0020C9F036|nr:PrsW family intramembrane metalloprotease [Natronosalvus amylolyticus]